jgi:hypothetical protein
MLRNRMFYGNVYIHMYVGECVSQAPVDMDYMDIESATTYAHDVNLQWRFLYGSAEAQPYDSQCEQLLDFAANPDASSSRFVRAFALERGIKGLLSIERNGRQLTDSQQNTLNRFRHIMPDEYFNGAVQYLLTTPRGDGVWPPDVEAYEGSYPLDSYHLAYHSFFVRLAENEGIRKELVTPDLDHSWVVDPIPVATGMFLQNSMQAANLDLLSPAMAEEAMDLFLDLRQPDFEAKAQLFSEMAKLARYTGAGGLEHDAPIDFLNTLPEQQRMEYAGTLNGLYESAKGLSDMFPEALGEKIVKGAQGLLADAMFALRAHLQASGQTHAHLELRNGGELPVDFEGNEPLLILQQLDTVFRKLQTTITSESTRSILVAEGEGFQIDRFIDINSSLPSEVTLYTRPYESVNYDNNYEYGRPGKGVEASISYKVQIEDMPTLLPLSKQAAATNVVSIRLDREHDGVISLDIGSILGNPASVGTKIGRLLALGNTLRSKVTGVAPGLNHVKDSLDQQYGREQEFAYLTELQRHRVQQMRATKKEFRDYALGARRSLVTCALASRNIWRKLSAI